MVAKESRMYVLNKRCEKWHRFYQEKSKSVLQLDCFGWKNKGQANMATKVVEVLWKRKDIWLGTWTLLGMG